MIITKCNTSVCFSIIFLNAQKIIFSNPNATFNGTTAMGRLKVAKNNWNPHLKWILSELWSFVSKKIVFQKPIVMLPMYSLYLKHSGIIIQKNRISMNKIKPMAIFLYLQVKRTVRDALKNLKLRFWLNGGGGGSSNGESLYMKKYCRLSYF